jgi:hypothetical protein
LPKGKVKIQLNAENEIMECGGKRKRDAALHSVEVFASSPRRYLLLSRNSSNSSGVFGQSFLSSNDSERSANSRPPVWHFGQ